MKKVSKIAVIGCRMRHAKNFLQILNRKGVQLGIKPHSIVGKRAFLQGQRRAICLDPAHY